MVSNMEVYTSCSRSVSHNIPGLEEITVFSKGTKINSRIRPPSKINAIIILSGLLQSVLAISPPLYILFSLPGAV
jgi:hypothetical protein